LSSEKGGFLKKNYSEERQGVIGATGVRRSGASLVAAAHGAAYLELRKSGTKQGFGVQGSGTTRERNGLQIARITQIFGIRSFR
jgi:hypothetical protein